MSAPSYMWMSWYVRQNLRVHTFPTTSLFSINVAGNLQWNCPIAPWSEGLTLIKPWTMQASTSKTLQHKDMNTQHKKTRSATLQSPTRETRQKKKKRLPRLPCQKKKAWLISQATWKLCLLLLLLDLLKAWIWVRHPPFSLSLSPSLPSSFFLTLSAFFFYLNKGPPPTSLPFVSHLVFCFC